MPRYSVLMTTYNRAAYLRQAVDSVLAQTYRDFEMIVCDDGSTDGTPAILESYGERIRVTRGEHRGMGAGLNAALSIAQGEFVSVLDSDDLWTPWTLERVDAAVAAIGQPACVYLQPTYFEGYSNPLQAARPAQTVYRVFGSYAEAPPHVPNGSGMIGAMPRRFFQEAGGFAEWPCGPADHDFLLRCARRIRYVSLDAPATVCVRQHRGRSINQAQARFDGVILMLKNHRRGLYGAGPDDAAVAARVGRESLSTALYLASQFGAWRQSARLFGRTLGILPRRLAPGLSAWYAAFLVAAMGSRLLEKFSRQCSRPLPASWPAAPRAESCR